MKKERKKGIAIASSVLVALFLLGHLLKEGSGWVVSSLLRGPCNQKPKPPASNHVNKLGSRSFSASPA
jgi:hypothetical protein